MKKAILILSLFLVAFEQQAQLKFYSGGGKTEVKQGKCGMTDLKVRIPVPANAASFDKLKFHVFLTPNSKTMLDPYSSPVFIAFIEKEDYAGKATIDLVLKGEDGSSQFAHRNSAVSIMDIDAPCSDEKRIEQNFKLSFELEGLKFLKNIINANGEQEPQYTAVSIKKFPDAFPFDYGFSDPNVYTLDKSFSVKKSYDFPVRVDPYEKEMTLSFSGSDILGQLKSVSGLSIEEVKEDALKALRNNTLPKTEETKVSWNMEMCYPCLAKKIKSSDDADADAKLKTACATTATWTATKISGLDGFVLDVPRTLHYYRWSKEASKISSSELKWGTLLIFAVEKKGKVYIGTFEFRSGDAYDGESIKLVEKFFKEAMASFKVY